MIPSLRRCSPLTRQQQRSAPVVSRIGGRAATTTATLMAKKGKPLRSLSRGRVSAATTTTMATTKTSALPSSSSFSSSSPSLSVVVTGGSKGLGKAIAREHLTLGDSVVVAARDARALEGAARELAEETGAELLTMPPSSPSSRFPSPSSRSRPRRPTITPIAADVSDLSSVERLVSSSLRAFAGEGAGGESSSLDALYCNAGESGGLRPFASSEPSDLSRVVATNLLGTVLCSRVAMEAMRSAHEERRNERGEEEEEEEEEEGSGSNKKKKQKKKAKAKTEFAGHLFRLEGAGSDLSATPGHAAYGATKAATAQLVKSLAAEERERAEESERKGGAGAGAAAAVVGVHALSPGLVLTPLLLSGLIPSLKDDGDGDDKEETLPLRSRLRALAFDALCEHPEVVAAFLVPRARDVILRSKGGEGEEKEKVSSSIRYLTAPRALGKLLSGLLFRRGRHFSPVDASPAWEESDRERIRRAKEKEELRRSKGEKRRREFAATAALFLSAVAVATVGREEALF